MTVLKHIHKLKKHTYKKTGMSVFFCTLPDCSYKVEYQFSLGKEALCNICGDPFLMNEYTLKLIRPHCNNCGRTEVKGPDGRKRYVRKLNTNVLAGVALDETTSLKDRLAKVTIAPMPVEDEDL
jgi:hypothetical protein